VKTAYGYGTVVGGNAVVVEFVAVTDVALKLAVVPDKQPVVVTSVTTQPLKNVVQMQILFISVTLIKLAVRVIAATLIGSAAVACAKKNAS